MALNPSLHLVQIAIKLLQGFVWLGFIDGFNKLAVKTNHLRFDVSHHLLAETLFIPAEQLRLVLTFDLQRLLLLLADAANDSFQVLFARDHCFACLFLHEL